MIKTSIASAMLLLFCSGAVRAGTLAWAPAGTYPSRSDCQPISFDQPDAIAVDHVGDIYIANEGGPNALQEITESGPIRTILDRQLEPIKSGRYFGLSLAIGPTGSIYLAIKNRGTVERLNPNGTLTVVAGKPGERKLKDGPAPEARLRSPNAIAVGPRAVIYVADSKTIRKIERDGSITTLAGNPRARNPYPDRGERPYLADGVGRHAVFMSPNGIAVSALGDVYVADGYEGSVEGQAAEIGVLRKVQPDGRVSTVAGTLNTMGGDSDDIGTAATFGYLFGVSIDPSGNVYVTEPFNASIRRIARSATVTTVVREQYPENFKSTGLVVPSGIGGSFRRALFVVNDYAITGFPYRHVDWFQRVVAGRVETLCQPGPIRK